MDVYIGCPDRMSGIGLPAGETAEETLAGHGLLGSVPTMIGGGWMAESDARRGITLRDRNMDCRVVICAR